MITCIENTCPIGPEATCQYDEAQVSEDESMVELICKQCEFVLELRGKQLVNGFIEQQMMNALK